ncbi:MAG: hypothetical protein KatS3mg110_4515 [Pirellulaceae bacterium]|nr:MAG: hypothetical protein KatS3mg110_4515 [Pirellulaceae bacterium]
MTGRWLFRFWHGVIVAALAVGPAGATQAGWNDFWRWWGIGHGDGYHAPKCCPPKAHRSRYGGARARLLVMEPAWPSAAPGVDLQPAGPLQDK